MSKREFIVYYTIAGLNVAAGMLYTADSIFKNEKVYGVLAALNFISAGIMYGIGKSKEIDYRIDREEEKKLTKEI